MAVVPSRGSATAGRLSSSMASLASPRASRALQSLAALTQQAGDRDRQLLHGAINARRRHIAEKKAKEEAESGSMTKKIAMGVAAAIAIIATWGAAAPAVAGAAGAGGAAAGGAAAGGAGAAGAGAAGAAAGGTAAAAGGLGLSGLAGLGMAGMAGASMGGALSDMFTGQPGGGDRLMGTMNKGLALFDRMDSLGILDLKTERPDLGPVTGARAIARPVAATRPQPEPIAVESDTRPKLQQDVTPIGTEEGRFTKLLRPGNISLFGG